MTLPNPPHGCTCRPVWPELVVYTDDDRILTVQPAESPGGLACLYQARCAGCTAQYPHPFRHISTSPRATWVWAPDERTVTRVRELVGGRPTPGGDELGALATDVDIGVTALENCETLAADGFTFTWHNSQHPLNRCGWPAQLPGMPPHEDVRG